MLYLFLFFSRNSNLSVFDSATIPTKLFWILDSLTYSSPVRYLNENCLPLASQSLSLSLSLSHTHTLLHTHSNKHKQWQFMCGVGCRYMNALIPACLFLSVHFNTFLKKLLLQYLSEVKLILRYSSL